MNHLDAFLAQIDAVVAECDARQLPPLAVVEITTPAGTTTQDQNPAKRRWPRHRIERMKPWWARRR